MVRITTIALSALLSFALAPVAIADTLSIVNEPNGVERPRSGMSMDQVKAKFGVANNELDAVGEPPITRWVYNDFTVYYEHHLVIHAVAHTHNGRIPTSPASSSGDNRSNADNDGPLFLH